MHEKQGKQFNRNYRNQYSYNIHPTTHHRFRFVARTRSSRRKLKSTWKLDGGFAVEAQVDRAKSPLLFAHSIQSGLLDVVERVRRLLQLVVQLLAEGGLRELRVVGRMLCGPLL